MTDVEILLAKEGLWRKSGFGETTVWWGGYVNQRSGEDVAAAAVRLTRQSLGSWLLSLDGHFAIIVQSRDYVFAVADRVASCPVLCARMNGGTVLSDSGPLIENRLEIGPEAIDREVSAAFALSGYTIADRTIYPSVKILEPGSLVWIENGVPQTESYAKWMPRELPEASDYRPAGLQRLHERLIQKLVTSLNGRPVVVPLSAGLDSRFVVSGLKEYGHKDVLCVSYGIPNNLESEVAREVARRLGYEWLFVPYTNRGFRDAYNSDGYAKFMDFADTLSSIHFVGEYLMMTRLKEFGHLNKRTVFINGQSGDFITGNHIPGTLLDGDRIDQERMDVIIAALIEKHYKIWSSLKSEPFVRQIEGLLEREIDGLGGLPEEAMEDFGLYEHLEFVNRQSKYVIGSVRTYEYFGHEWRLPLWDVEYLDYWENAPLSAKAHQSLYKEALVESNWGGVWRDIDVNPNRISPRWIIPVRFFFKVVFALFGRAAWHRFERRYLDYFMATTCSYAPWPYFDVVRDKRQPFNALAFYIESYLQRKGLSWDGQSVLPSASRRIEAD